MEPQSEIYQLGQKEALGLFKSEPAGLSEPEAKSRLEEYGLNRLEKKKRITPFQIFINQFKSFLIWILLAAVLLSVLIGYISKNPEDYIDAGVILAIVIINALLGFFQEYRAEKAMDALQKMAAPRAKIIRDGQKKVISSEEVVPGDIILLETGDSVPADARIIELFNLKVDEATLTGESSPVTKILEKIGKVMPVAERKNLVFSGTIVTHGKAHAVVYATGMQTEFGKIAAMVQEEGDKETPLQKKLGKVGKLLGILMIAISALVFALGAIRGTEILTMILTAVSLAVAAVPEGLPAVVTITLAIGLTIMARSNAVVRKLSAVETLGSTTVICSDKTGTLTKNEMTVRLLSVGGKKIKVGGSGYEPLGELGPEQRLTPADETYLDLLMKAAVLCNNAELTEGVKWGIFGDPTEGALLVLARKAGYKQEEVAAQFERVYEIEFTSERKMMSTIHKRDSKDLIVFAKGAPETLLDKCTLVFDEGKVKRLTPQLKKKILELTKDMAADALRVLGFAYREFSPKGKYEDGQAEHELVFIGLAGMIDPPREGVLEAVKLCKSAGIRPIMITGDHKLTAEAIAKEIGVAEIPMKALTGEELDKIGDAELEKEIAQVSVYARVSPEHKVRILDALKRRGEIVAMTGDGVNDAPAIKKSDIGIAMGITGTDVAKEASDMVLQDDNFATIVKAVEQGRGIFNNIRKFVLYLLSSNIGEIITIFLAVLIGWPLPLVAVQILWVNLLTDGLPAVALSVDPFDSEIMRRPPRSPGEPVINRAMWIDVTLIGAIIGLGTLGAFYLTMPAGIEVARTVAFATLVMFQMFNVYNIRLQAKSVFSAQSLKNPYLHLSVLISILLLLLVVYIAPMQRIFETTAIDSVHWAYVLAISAVVLVVTEIKKALKL